MCVLVRENFAALRNRYSWRIEIAKYKRFMGYLSVLHILPSLINMGTGLVVFSIGGFRLMLWPKGIRLISLFGDKLSSNPAIEMEKIVYHVVSEMSVHKYPLPGNFVP